MTPTSPEDFPRVAILTDDGGNLPARMLVLACLEAGRPLAGVVIDPVTRRSTPARPGLAAQYLRYLSRGMWGYAWRKFRRGVVRRRAAADDMDLEALCRMGGVPAERAENVNRPEGRAVLERMTPDVLVMMGCRILKSEALGVASLALNFHTGLLPDYRGGDTIFWAMREGRPERVGYSIHRAVEALDGGEVYVEEAVAPRRGELIEEIYERLVARATPRWIPLLEQYAREGKLAGRPLELSQGKVYRSADWWQHAVLENEWK
jgi:folate-dependent phosphoribosylglycinamide formyltransferase PurN